MSRRSKRKASTTPSLFPFLAVLICTLGAIIVLLVLVVKNADVQATEASRTDEKELEERKQQWRDRLELETSQVETLQELRPDLKNRLAEQKAAYGHLADHVSRLQRELDRLRASLNALDAERDPGSSANQRAEQIAALKQQLEVARQELESRRQQIATAKPAYSIIPQGGGGNGTFRRPIFVECTAEGVTLQPYGITLRPADFPATMGPDNPLDLALLMIRDYWNQLDPNRSAGQPYPLFVVRPSGSRAFAAARKAMKSWVDEFGYELVAADIDIEYPAADPAFQQRLELAVQQARIQQQNQVAALNRQQVMSRLRSLDEGSSSPGGFRASSVTGGFVREGNGLVGAGNSGTTVLASSRQASSENGQTFSSGANPAGSFDGSRDEMNGDRNGQPSSLTRDSAFAGSGAAGSSSGDGPAGPGGFGSEPASDASLGTPRSGSDASLPPESLAQTRGVDWALPSKANNSIQVRKPIKVQVTRDAIRIVELGRGIKSIPLGGSTANAVPGLVEEVWKHIDAWGIAGVNSYWKPTLNLYVEPDAESRYEDLKVLLAGSGLELRRAQP